MGKQVKTPRFYVDIPSFLHATGDEQWAHGGHSYGYNGGTNHGGADLLYMNPSNPFMRQEPHTSDPSYIFKIGQNYPDVNPKTGFSINFCALLNHNLATHTNGSVARPFVRGRLMKLDGSGNRAVSSRNFHTQFTGFTSVLNYNLDASSNFDPTFNGTSIAIFDDSDPLYWTTFEVFYPVGIPYDEEYPHQLGSFVVGKYWDAPNSPDLNLTMSRRFDGIKRQKTIGGKTLANIYYDGATEWTMNRLTNDYGGSATYKYPPFELDAEDRVDGDYEASYSAHFDQRAKSGLGRKGLRSWKLTFSYISEDDMWMAYESSSNSPFIGGGQNAETGGTPPTDDSNSVDTYANPMLQDDSFNFVWNCTLGGTLPFIFQPDNTNNNPDQFSICTFRGNSLSVKQVAFNTYSLSITIDEVA